jgi:Tfp pilus assembly protein PilV
MRSRAAVSLVEVLVATVLLAIGVAGSVAAFVAAARGRMTAAAREGAAAAADRRLAWFEAVGCTTPDTMIAVGAPDREHWVLDRDSTTSRLEGWAASGVGSRVVTVPLTLRRDCR